MHRHHRTALCLSLFCLLGGAPRASQAQRLLPCDAKGNIIDNSNGIMTQVLQGFSVSNTYNQDALAKLLTIPSMGLPCSTDIDVPSLYNGGISNVYADNYVSNGTTSIQVGNPPVYVYFNGSVTTETDAEDRIYYKWTDTTSLPKYQVFLITEGISGGCTIPSIGLQAKSTLKNSFNDTYTADGTYGMGGSVSHKYLVRSTPDSNNIFEVYIGLKGKSDAYNGVQANLSNLYGSNLASAQSIVYDGATAVPDSRIVSLQSNLGLTYHKGDQQEREPDLPDALGNTNANTVGDPDGFQLSFPVTYTATPAGAWAPNSSYKYDFHISSNGSGTYTTGPDSGTFTVPSPAPASYNTTVSWVGNITTASARLTDANDGCTADATYTLTLHQPVENWIKDGKSVEIDPDLKGQSSVPLGLGSSTVITFSPQEGVEVSDSNKEWVWFCSTVTTLIGGLDPPTWVFPLLAGMNIATSSIDPPQTATMVTPQLTTTQFLADAATARLPAIDLDTSDIVAPYIARMDDQLAQDALIYPLSHFTDPQNGSLVATVSFYFKRFNQPFVGDAYDTHGYSGPAHGWVKYSDFAPQYVYQWKFIRVGSPG